MRNPVATCAKLGGKRSCAFFALHADVAMGGFARLMGLAHERAHERL